MNIKIIGSNCSNGIKLKKMVNKVSSDFNINIEVLDDNNSIKKYNVKNIPGLIINDTKVSEGKVLSDREISRYIKSYVL